MPLPGEPVVQKRFESAFFETDLEKTLRDLGIKTLCFCGLATSGHVNATVMCAVCKGYDTVVVKDTHGAQGLPGLLGRAGGRALQPGVGAGRGTADECEGRDVLGEDCAPAHRGDDVPTPAEPESAKHP